MKNPLTGAKLLDYARQTIAEEELLLKDIQESQWDKGEDKERNVIGRYKESTQNIAKLARANRPKQKGKRYNLDWSGDLRRKTDIKSKRRDNDVVVVIDSSSSSLLELFSTIERYGLIRNPNTIFGYNKENLDRVKKIIKKGLKVKTKQNHGV